MKIQDIKTGVKITPSKLFTGKSLIGLAPTREEALKLNGIKVLYPVTKQAKNISVYDAGCYVTVGGERRGRDSSYLDIPAKKGRKLNSATIQEFKDSEIEWIEGTIEADYWGQNSADLYITA